MGREILISLRAVFYVCIFFSSLIEASDLLTGVPSFVDTSTTTNQYFVSIFGTKEADKQLDALSIQFQYGIASSLLTTTLVNGGTATTSNSQAVLSTSGIAGAVAGLQTLSSVQYRSGHEANTLFTAAFTGSIAANTKQYIGIIDSSNGFAIGFNGTSFGIVSRNNGLDTFVAQTNFNGDLLNGTGASQFTYNPIQLNVFRIAYGWLGSAVIDFQILSNYGNWITFHTIQQPNVSNTPSIANAMLPMSAQVIDSAGGNNLTLQTASWNMGIVGVASSVANRYFMISNTAALLLFTETHFLTILNQTTFQSLPNKVNITLSDYFVGQTATAVPMILRVYKNATVTGTSFANVSTGNSVCAYSTAGTFTSGTGTLLLVIPFAANSVGTSAIIPGDLYNIIAYPGEQLTMTIQVPSALTTVIGGLQWSEGF